jgi:plastocyanin domain-containing protein
MTTSAWVVIAIGGAAIAWVNWYFFFAERRSATATRSADIQQVEIEVRGGYDPGVVRLARDVPARLVFNRTEASPCSEEVVIPAFGIRRFLPPHQKTAIELTPREAGRFEITCGMSMLHGTLVVEG